MQNSTIHLPALYQGAEPFYVCNHHAGGAGSIGCLVLHGFMASPNEVIWLAQALADAGHTVYAPRLTGHGIDHRHMPRMRWQDWYGHALDAYLLLRQQCEQVIVLGHSMGGLLATLIASQQAVDGVVIAGSPYRTPNPIMRFGRWVALGRPFIPMDTPDDYMQIVREEQERRGESQLGRVNYRLWSTRAVYELYRLIGVADQHLPDVNAPALLVYARDDDTVPFDDLAYAVARLPQTPQQVVVESGSHLIFQDVGHREAIDAVLAFVGSYVSASSSRRALF